MKRVIPILFYYAYDIINYAWLGIGILMAIIRLTTGNVYMPLIFIFLFSLGTAAGFSLYSLINKYWLEHPDEYNKFFKKKINK